MYTIRVVALTKIFNNQVKAVDGISFNVDEGEILGFLGPNGAGKTTTLNMLSTLLKPTSGAATVNGYDVVKEPDAVRQSIGYVFQDPTLDIELTGRENLDFHGRLYNLDRNLRRQRIEEMLETVQLTDRADNLVKTYSGGMKRRLEIARGLLHHPKVLFLDEPTLGLDPQTRRSIWEHIQRLNKEKKITIILTTHYTEEADFLCGRILIIDFGRIVALDTSDMLKAQLEGDIVSLIFEDPLMISKLRPIFEGKNWIRRVYLVSKGDNRVNASKMMSMVHEMAGGHGTGGASQGSYHESGVGSRVPEPIHKIPPQDVGSKFSTSNLAPSLKRLDLLVDDGGRRIPAIVKLVDEAGAMLESVELHKPTLDDVFISVTGRNIRDQQGSFTEMARRFHIMRQARGGQRHG
ncbi:MAG: ATP-binding cassette domain-containing protein [Candidatus Bathyarchaeota archaeon]|nr:MAG: ATP-binding cassette domain-containing protein [Candidatus Bathyarchaeota archaeon]